MLGLPEDSCMLLREEIRGLTFPDTEDPWFSIPPPGFVQVVNPLPGAQGNRLFRLGEKGDETNKQTNKITLSSNPPT